MNAKPFEMDVAQYVVSPKGVTHLTDPNTLSLTSLCGLYLVNWVFGDETPSGIATDCKTCKRTFRARANTFKLHRTRTSHTVWVCVDCAATEANGEPSDDPDYTPDREPLSRLAAVEHSLGMAFSEHVCDDPGNSECECEQREFSWLACEGCGSTLGGAREAMTIWITGWELTGHHRAHGVRCTQDT